MQFLSGLSGVGAIDVNYVQAQLAAREQRLIGRVAQNVADVDWKLDATRQAAGVYTDAERVAMNAQRNRGGNAGLLLGALAIGALIFFKNR